MIELTGKINNSQRIPKNPQWVRLTKNDITMHPPAVHNFAYRINGKVYLTRSTEFIEEWQKIISWMKLSGK